MQTSAHAQNIQLLRTAQSSISLFLEIKKIYISNILKTKAKKMRGCELLTDF
jgi:hypothetical protein